MKTLFDPKLCSLRAAILAATLTICGCNGIVSTPFCSGNDECALGEICSSITGTCVKVCSRHTHCAETELCFDGLCGEAPTCSEESPCPPNSVCVVDTCRRTVGLGSPCQKDEECDLGFCDTQSTTCRVLPAGESCTRDLECSSKHCESLVCSGCGDGILDLDRGESCDDGDAMSGDGCSSTCDIEPGFGCTGAPSVCSEVIFVSAAAESNGDGMDWVRAFVSLQDGLTALATRPDAEIWVAAGTYTPGARDQSFTLPQGVTTVRLLGGFAGNETLRERRDPAVHRVVLSGDNGGDDAARRFSDNSFHVLHFSQGAEVELEGVEVSAGRATGEAAETTQRGGGILLESGQLRLRDSTVRDNAAATDGGGIAVDGGALILEPGAIVTGNAAKRGGGIFVGEDGTVRAGDGSQVSGNDATSGGGFFAAAAAALHMDPGLVVAGNTAILGAGVATEKRTDAQQARATLELVGTTLEDNVAGKGGGILCDDCSLRAREVTFAGNTARQGEGGGVLLQGASAELLAVSVARNEALVGGGVSCAGSSLTVVASKVSNNHAAASGGGMASSSCTLEITESEFGSNVALREHGGALSVVGGIVEVLRSTFTQNEAQWGGALSVGQINDSDTGLSIVECRFEENRAVDGGALHLNFTTELTTVVESTDFIRNVSLGEAFPNGGGAILLGHGTSLTLAGCRLAENQAGCGGGILSLGALHLVDTLLEHNRAGESGGAWAQFVDPTGTVGINVRVLHNEASVGGALFAYGPIKLIGSLVAYNETANWGALFVYSYLKLDFSTIAYNSGKMSEIGSQITAMNTTIKGTIVTGPEGAADLVACYGGSNPDPYACTNDVSLFAENSLIRGYSDPPSGALTVDPKLVDPTAGDFTLAEGSPAIDKLAGDDLPLDTADLDGDEVSDERLPVDLDGHSRSVVSTNPASPVDIGAFERQP